MNCTICQRPLEDHFRIMHMDKNGTTGNIVLLCSVACIVRWAYDYSKQQGARAAFKVHNIWQQLRDVFK